ncbi:hypothetical protein BZA05DRAFT_470270 [Tricharina praecox]|uniref:uncharacterized protein n=1 Tax=Tricharina praecox TaxID=43433 RepID=UPI00221F843A|nr:uncharacterized protein BZA05DRAFT_470270 [Tricharina praecox]KAI5859077.1 hypothetical protein BZA05DRAFT_470270 [Tricharina praecox]
MAENHQRSYPPRASSPDLFLLPSPHSHRGSRTTLTPSALLLRLTHLQSTLQQRRKTLAALFLLTFSVHTLLWPPLSPSEPHIPAALLLWTLFLLPTSTPWVLSRLLAPAWISLLFRLLAGVLPALVAPVYALWALSVYGWATHAGVRGYADGTWAVSEEAARIRQVLADVEGSVGDFATRVLSRVLCADVRGGRVVEGTSRREGTSWTNARLMVFRPPAGDRKAVWAEFEGFVAAAKSEIASLSAEVEGLLGVKRMGAEEMVYRERVRVYVETTLGVWEGLYAELMHPHGKDEAARPEVGERLPRRVANAVRWFEAVEEKGIEVVVVDEET